MKSNRKAIPFCPIARSKFTYTVCNSGWTPFALLAFDQIDLHQKTSCLSLTSHYHQHPYYLMSKSIRWTDAEDKALKQGMGAQHLSEPTTDKEPPEALNYTRSTVTAVSGELIMWLDFHGVAGEGVRFYLEPTQCPTKRRLSVAVYIPSFN